MMPFRTCLSLGLKICIRIAARVVKLSRASCSGTEAADREKGNLTKLVPYYKRMDELVMVFESPVT